MNGDHILNITDKTVSNPIDKIKAEVLPVILKFYNGFFSIFTFTIKYSVKK